jgi:hypothetical protein
MIKHPRFSFMFGALLLGATRDLSSETIGGFTGVYVGMYATGNGRKSTHPADFDRFEYQAERP